MNSLRNCYFTKKTSSPCMLASLAHTQILLNVSFLFFSFLLIFNLAISQHYLWICSDGTHRIHEQM